MKALIGHYKRHRAVYSALGDTLCGTAFFGLVFLFCWLCCACSGYHWEQ